MSEMRANRKNKKQKAIKYYLEENGFRKTERLIHVSHVSVINCVKKAAKEIRKRIKFKQKKIKVLKLNEMCINFKKKYMDWDSCKHDN